MNPIEINSTNFTSKIFIEKSIDRLALFLPKTTIIVLIDQKVNHLYPHLFEHFSKIEIEASEERKSLETVYEIYEKLLNLGADRHTFLLGVGGGITCDITGYVASTFMRGMHFGFVATTLMAQVDAAIGGKNGVNFNQFKNIIGTINQPDFVWCDVQFLNTLPPRELNAGFAEIIKYGLIQAHSIIDDIEKNNEKYTHLDLTAIAELIKKCASIKAHIVNEDENENGRRKILNFGHTIGHAIEKTTSKYNHGEAVSIGMMIALRISEQRGNLSTFDVDRICRILQQYNLPTTIDNFPQSEIINAINTDKKRNNEMLDYIILNKIGEAKILAIATEELKLLILTLLR